MGLVSKYVNHIKGGVTSHPSINEQVVKSRLDRVKGTWKEKEEVPAYLIQCGGDTGV